MQCSQVHQSLHDNERGLPAVALAGLRFAAVWAHLAGCPRCRAEARSLRVLRRALREAGRFGPPPGLLPSILGVPQDASPVQTKEKIRMRRIAFASLAMLALALAAAVLVPRGTRSEADSILVGVAHAMAEATSLHAVFRTTEATSDTPTGLRIMPGRGEYWMDGRGMHFRYLAPDGRLRMAGAVDVAAGKFWFYQRADRTRYVADLAPVSGKAAEVIARWSRMILAGRVVDALGKELRHAQKSVATQTRDGRKVAMVTITFPYPASPRRVRARTVFEVEAETNHLLRMRQFARVAGAPEQLIATVDNVEYDVPLPAGLAALPEGTRTVPATARIARSKHTLSLVIRAGGAEVNRIDVPR